MKKFIYMVASIAFLTACHSQTATENKAETSQVTATSEQTTVSNTSDNVSIKHK